MPYLTADHLRTLADVLENIQNAHENLGGRVTGHSPFLVDLDDLADQPTSYVSVSDDGEQGYRVEVSS